MGEAKHNQRRIEQLEREVSDLKFNQHRYSRIVKEGLPGMAFGHLNHEQMAGKVRMLMRNDLGHEGVCVGARDRIIWLANRVYELEQENEALKKELQQQEAQAQT